MVSIHFEAALCKTWFNNILVQWLQGRSIMQQESDLEEYAGKYDGLNTSVDTFMDQQTAQLAMTINSCDGLRQGLVWSCRGKIPTALCLR